MNLNIVINRFNYKKNNFLNMLNKLNECIPQNLEKLSIKIIVLYCIKEEYIKDNVFLIKCSKNLSKNINYVIKKLRTQNLNNTYVVFIENIYMVNKHLFYFIEKFLNSHRVKEETRIVSTFNKNGSVLNHLYFNLFWLKSFKKIESLYNLIYNLEDEPQKEKYYTNFNKKYIISKLNENKEIFEYDNFKYQRINPLYYMSVKENNKKIRPKNRNFYDKTDKIHLYDKDQNLPYKYRNYFYFKNCKNFYDYQYSEIKNNIKKYINKKSNLNNIPKVNLIIDTDRYLINKLIKSISINLGYVLNIKIDKKKFPLIYKNIKKRKHQYKFIINKNLDYDYSFNLSNLIKNVNILLPQFNTIRIYQKEKYQKFENKNNLKIIDYQKKYGYPKNYKSKYDIAKIVNFDSEFFYRCLSEKFPILNNNANINIIDLENNILTYFKSVK